MRPRDELSRAEATPLAPRRGAAGRPGPYSGAPGARPGGPDRRTETDAGIARWPAIALLLVALAVFAACFLLGVMSTTGQHAENTLLEASEFRYEVPAPLSLVSVWTVSLAAILVALIASAGAGWRGGAQLLASMGVPILLSQFLKNSVIERPELAALGQSNSFPSGHATVAAALCLGLVLALPPALRWIGVLVGLPLVSMVAWQLLAFGWHRPSDVIGGIALAAAGIALGCVLRPRRAGETPRRRDRSPRAVAVILALIAAAALALAGLMGAYALWNGIDGQQTALLYAGEVGSVAAATLAAAAVTGLRLRR